MTRPPADSTPVVAQALGSARHWLATQIRSKVIGDQPETKTSEIMSTPGPRWFADDSVIRRVHSDASMFIGGLSALLLQSLHPLAMAGVAQHSDYRADPWGRLQRTADFLAATTFGPIPLAERSIATVRKVHERVVGTTDDGRAYSANDPHLLRWVHVCEVSSFLAAYQRYGNAVLSAEDADAFVRDAGFVARKLGVNEAPVNVRELRAELREYRPELRSTKAAREAARFLLLEPPLPLAARAPYAVIGAAAVSLLPSWTRWPLRVPFLPVIETVIVRPAGAAITQLIRWSLTPVAAA